MARNLPHVLTLGCALALSCHPATPPVATLPSATSIATAGIADPALAQIVDAYWAKTLALAPGLATEVGEPRYNARLATNSPAERQARRALVAATLAQLDALAAALRDSDQLTHALLRHELAAELAADLACDMDTWNISVQQGSPLGQLSNLWYLHPKTTVAELRDFNTRLTQAPALVDNTIAALREGRAQHRVAPREQLHRVATQLGNELAQPTAKWALAAPVTLANGEDAAAVTAERLRLLEALRPHLLQLLAVIQQELMPQARVDNVGVRALFADGNCYRAQIAVHVGEPRDPAAIHALGLAEITKTDARLLELGQRVFGVPTLAATLAHLRTDRALYFRSADELRAAARAALARAKAALPRMVSQPPQTDCIVSDIPAHEAPYTHIAYYRPPVPGGRKPGEFCINTHAAETKPRYEIEALTWHEAIPGHHLQLAFAQALGELPAFRRFSQFSAFIEGWALYAEAFAEELGLYSSDLDRLGQASFAAWRAARLVVDTGLHHLGWTPAHAEAFLREHTALTEANIKNEVARYISWPGQALAYKLGQLEISALRTRAEAQLGPRFSLIAFHDQVLGAGPLPLPLLRARIEAWLAAQPIH